MHDDTHHKSFEERVDEVLKEHIQIVGDGWWHPNYSIGELKAALLAAHKEDVERIKDELIFIWLKRGCAMEQKYSKIFVPAPTSRERIKHNAR